jgi:type IV secretion system protein VirB3
MSDALEHTTLYIAATRPALFFGVPLAIAGGFMMLAGFLIVILQNPLYELLIAPLWVGAKFLVERDYNAASVIVLWLQTAARSVDGPMWGGASVSPNPVKVPPRGRGIV